MSKLTIYSGGSKEFKLNCTQFRSPMSAAINSVQTKTMLQHFPIRCGQPDINFTVQYENLDVKHAFEAFVRTHQVEAQKEGSDAQVTLWWPERNIENWTGFITTYTVQEKRFEVAPSAIFGVSLIKSLMSEETKLSSRGIDINKIFGQEIPAYIGYLDTILIRPARTGDYSFINPQDTVYPPPSGPTPPAPTYNGGGGTF